jgi:hypothetical protein
MKRLVCTVGLHAWTRQIERGESYKVCSACGHSPRARPYNAAAHAEGLRGGFGFKLIGLAVLAGIVALMIALLIYNMRVWERSRGQGLASQPSLGARQDRLLMRPVSQAARRATPLSPTSRCGAVLQQQQQQQHQQRLNSPA